MWKNFKKRLKTKQFWFVAINLFVLVFLLLFLLSPILVPDFANWTARISDQFERLSAFLAVIDDLIVRLLAIILLVIAVVGILINEIRALFGFSSLYPKERHFGLLKFSALVGLSGASFFAAYPLDSMDDEDFTWLGGSIQATVLAQWVQVVPASSDCQLAANNTSADSAIDSCPYNFLVRAVVDRGARCPVVEITYDGGQDASAEWLRSRKHEPRPGFEDIQVCQLPLAGRSRPQSVKFPNDETINVMVGWPKEKGPQRVVVFGDTGCRADGEQKCVRGEDWPLSQIAQAAATDDVRPDLVIHVGDFMYMKFDVWETWKASFFDPAKPLLAAAPWIMVRGNHERCGDNGDAPQGFYLFFDQGNVKNCENEWELIDTYAVDLSQDHRLIVVDSSISFSKDGIPNCDTEKDKACQALRNVFQHIVTLSKGEMTVWIATHVPPFALEWPEKKNDKGRPEVKDKPVFPGTSAMMLGLWRNFENTLTNVKVIFSGDRHLFQVVNDEKNRRPLQITVGTGGVNLDGVPPGRGLDHLSEPPVGHGWLDNEDRGLACSYESFGYLLAERNGRSYGMAFHPLGKQNQGNNGPCAKYLP